MNILTKTQIHEKLQTYYQDNYGNNDEDVWYSAPAANVWMFRRNGKIVTLQCHLLTGVVTEQTVEIPEGGSL